MYMRIFLSRPNQNGKTLKLNIFGSFHWRRLGSMNVNPVFEEVTARFVKFGGVVHF